MFVDEGVRHAVYLKGHSLDQVHSYVALSKILNKCSHAESLCFKQLLQWKELIKRGKDGPVKDDIKSHCCGCKSDRSTRTSC